MHPPRLHEHPPTVTSGAASARRTALLGVILLLIGLNMRPAIVAVSPLLETIRAATGMSHVAAGILTALPLVCFGIFAPTAPLFSKRFGVEATLMGVLVLLAIGTALRLLPQLSFLFVGTLLIGTAVAVANVVVTAVIKRDFSHRVGLLSGLHTTMLVGGAALAAGLTEPIRDTLNLTWRQGISVWGVLAVLAIAAWAPFSVRRDLAASANGQTRSKTMWASPLGWAVALFYAFQSLIYYTTTSWIPSFYIAHGYSTSAAGGLLAVLFLSAVATSVTTPLVAEKSSRQGYLVVIGGLACAVSVAALIVAPTAAPLVAVALLGLGLGTVLSLGITFMSTRAADHSSAGQLSAMSQCVGYLVAAAGPAVFGAAKDATGSWTTGLVAVLIATIPMTVSGYLCGRGGHV